MTEITQITRGNQVRKTTIIYHTKEGQKYYTYNRNRVWSRTINLRLEFKKYYKVCNTNSIHFFFIDARKVTGRDPIIRQILSLDIKGVRPV